MVEARGLVKVYPGGVRAVDGVSFCIREGEVYGLLGPNGAGKTTTVRMLATLIRPTSGDAVIAGYSVVREPWRVRRVIGLVPQDLTSDDEMTGWDNVLLQAHLHGLRGREAVERARWALEYMGLLDAANRRVSTYSGGMRRRLEIAMSLVHDPKVIFLDEPTLGLDVQSRRHLWGLIERLRSEGRTILLTTHYMEEAERLSDRVGIIDHGRIIVEGTPEELKARIGGDRVHLRYPDEDSARDAAARLEGAGYRVKLAGDTVIVTVENAARELARIARLAGEPLEVVVRRPNLEEVFLEFTGRSLREDEEALDSFRYRVMSRRLRR